MTARRTHTRTIATALAAIVLAGPAATSASAAVATDTGPTHERAVEPRTRLTFVVEACEGCEVALHQARRTMDADVVKVWSSRTREVEDGKVSFRPPSRRTEGMVATVRAPWEGNTGYTTTVAWRYAGKRVGETVTLAEAVGKERASACWAGTSRRRVEIPLVVEEVEVDGVQERVPGAIAFASVTQDWLRPMREAYDGVLGSQDVDLCG